MWVFIDATNVTGLVGFISVLKGEYGAKVIASDDNAIVLAKAGLEVIKLSTYTDSHGVLGGRINVLNPIIFGGVIGREKDKDALDARTIPLIDYVIANLQTKSGDYPEEESRDMGVGRAALIHASAMNDRVVVVCNPGNYREIIREMYKNSGAVTDDIRYRLDELAMKHVADYYQALYKKLKEDRQPTRQYFVPILLGNRTESPPSSNEVRT